MYSTFHLQKSITQALNVDNVVWADSIFNIFGRALSGVGIGRFTSKQSALKREFRTYGFHSTNSISEHINVEICDLLVSILTSIIFTASQFCQFIFDDFSCQFAI